MVCKSHSINMPFDFLGIHFIPYQIVIFKYQDVEKHFPGFSRVNNIFSMNICQIYGKL